MHLERVEPEPRTGELYGNEPGSSFVLVAGPVLVDEPPRFSALILTVSPPDAAVQIVGGPPAAESLLRTLRVDPTRTAERRYHLPIGDYGIRVTRDGYAPVERQLTLSTARSEIRITLSRQ